jgi:hypothetical protein
MNCDKHPNYRGIKKTKRDCDGCKAIFQRRQEKERAKGGLHPSITTPGQLFGINHLLAEISCTMLFGKQPPYFWRKDSASHPKVKSHYKTILMGTKKMKFKKYDTPIFGNNPIDSFGKLMWYVAGRYDTDQKMREITGGKAVKKEEIIQKKEEEKVESDETFFDVKKTNKKRKFQNLKDLGEEDNG